MKYEIKAEQLEKLIESYQRFTKWVLKHNPEIKESQRGKDHLKEIDDRESDIATIERQLLQEQPCEHCDKPIPCNLECEKQLTDNLPYPNPVSKHQTDINIGWIRAMKFMKEQPGQTAEDEKYKKQMEIRKVLQSVALHGYDLVSAEYDILKLL
jgi:hypothetical protein